MKSTSRFVAASLLGLQLLLPLLLPQQASAQDAVRVAGCPLAGFDADVNRFVVEPVNVRVRTPLELRVSQPGTEPCTGRLLERELPLTLEAAHYDSARGIWRGVLAVPPEMDGSRETSLDVCVAGLDAGEDACIARLGDHPAPSALEKASVWVPRKHRSLVQGLIWVIVGLLLAWIGLVAVAVIVSPWLVAKLFPEDTEGTAGTAAPPTSGPRANIPSVLDVIVQFGSELGSMAAGSLALLLVCFCFIFQRELTVQDEFVFFAYPICLVFIHIIVLIGSCSKTLLYHAALVKDVHIVFSKQAAPWARVAYIVMLLCTIAYLWCGISTIWHEHQLEAQQRCQVEECSRLASAISVAVRFWVLLFPSVYCMFLIYRADTFDTRLVGLYKIFQETEGEQAEVDAEAPKELASRFLGGLTPVDRDDFLRAGVELCKTTDLSGIDARTVAQASVDQPEEPTPHMWRDWKEIGGQHRWRVEALSAWAWRLRLTPSQHRVRDIALLLALCISTVFLVLIFVTCLGLFRITLYPTLESIQCPLGDIHPPFSPHVFDYNLFVDQKVQGATFEITSNKDYVASTSLVLPLADEAALAAEEDEEWSQSNGTDYLPGELRRWAEALKSVHVPFSMRSPDDKEGGTAVGDEDLRSGQKASVPIEIVVRGAGRTVVYRITVIKTETRLAALDYRYNTSSDVDEVFVHKAIDWDREVPDDVASRKPGEAVPDADGHSLNVYVPEETESLVIDFKREMSIYGPASNTVLSGADLDEFDAARRLMLCPPHRHGNCQSAGSDEEVQLQEHMTALPVLLRPQSGDPLRLLVNVVRVSNRLIDLNVGEVAGAGIGSDGDGGPPAWLDMGILPVFRPLKTSYQTFFSVPRGAASLTMSKGEEQEEASKEVHTVFFKVRPQGDARVNWLEADLIPEAGSRWSDLQAFCRPATAEGDDDAPLDPTVQAGLSELSCGAPSGEADAAEGGKPTPDLVIRTADGVFRDHFYVRYRFKVGDARPFSLRMRVMHHGDGPREREDGSAADQQANDASAVGQEYEMKFLPQEMERFELFSTLAAASPAANATESPRSPKAALIQAQEDFNLPLFLSPPYRADVFEYQATIPRGAANAGGAAGSLTVSLTDGRSLWVGTGGDARLQTPGMGEALQSRVPLRLRSDGCETEGDDEEAVAAEAEAPASEAGPAPAPAPAPAPYPAAAPAEQEKFCPVKLHVYRRGYHRRYVVHVREAHDGDLLYLGLYTGPNKEMHNTSSPAMGKHKPRVLPGFQPGQTDVSSTLADMTIRWRKARKNATAVAKAAAPGHFLARAVRRAERRRWRRMLFEGGAASFASLGVDAPTEPTDEDAAEANAQVNDSSPSNETTSAEEEAEEAAEADADAWPEEEEIPVARLAAMVASGGHPSAASRPLQAFWNDVPVRTEQFAGPGSGGEWWHVKLDGRTLMEACWCNQAHVGSTCRQRLSKKAPMAVERFLRPNLCHLTLKVSNATSHSIHVGHAHAPAESGVSPEAAAAADPASLEAAFDSTASQEERAAADGAPSPAAAAEVAVSPTSVAAAEVDEAVALWREEAVGGPAGAGPVSGVATQYS
eukprot:TRINITY_DN34066_c0_g1_i1.p1 TRINITY_DN34066_c0_g1~~TRINITY_DN34066_c0_g1_i1.p1  ORF type:complete len:1579 (-),score=405.82 TRINITY_DN34066_c0_g1_i1:152-4888(-)